MIYIYICVNKDVVHNIVASLHMCCVASLQGEPPVQCYLPAIYVLLLVRFQKQRELEDRIHECAFSRNAHKQTVFFKN